VRGKVVGSFFFIVCFVGWDREMDGESSKAHGCKWCLSNESGIWIVTTQMQALTVKRGCSRLADGMPALP
jgi:hypothetical protein